VYQNFLKHMDRIIQQRPVAKEALISFREILVIICESGPEIQPVVLEERLSKIKQTEDAPLFFGGDFPFDPFPFYLGPASKLLKKLLRYLRAVGREDTNGLKRALKSSNTELEWSENLFRAILVGDKMRLSKISKEVDLNPEVLQFLGRMAIKPSLFALRETISDTIEKMEWENGYCPVCGSGPDMACFEKNGKRYLHCGLCGQKWPFPRVRCPFCDNHDHETLGYFQAETEEGFRIDFCRKCQKYIKTIDKRAFEEPAPLELENLATIHLDLLAAEHGFK